MKFNFQQYLTRVIKYLIYLAIVFTLVVAIFSLTSGTGFSFTNLFREGTEIQIIVFLLAMSIIYPFFGYAKKKVYLNKSYLEDKAKIVDVFDKSRFSVEFEGTTSTTFRHKSVVVRMFRMFEDRIVLDFSDNPISLEGQRKDVYRIARMIEYAVRDDRNDG
ncbi:MAG: hypothetical protein CVU13_07625 [Bacteroidetes bacterium HGW-Bacteroidetes-8]|jgi:hypothetical protein|nr:MAG: hypothetical protein CVU13_07625 [Bacteroidetes bacterium HGW-Bacteroidetes-8]